MSPTVLPFFHADSNTFTYLVADESSGAAAIIDPVLDFDGKSGRIGTRSAEAVLTAVRERGWRVVWLLETHAHADHLSAGDWLRRHTPGARLAIGEGICSVQRTFAEVFNLGSDFACDGSQFDHLFTDGERFALGEIPAQVIAVPGHTNDSVAYLIGDALFPGDSLFMPDGGTARCDFPGGDAAALYRSIHKLYALPAATRVFVCHDYGPNGREISFETSIGEEKRRNIHVRDGVSETDYVTLRQARDATLAVPNLLLPSVQVNIRAGALPKPEANGVRYLKLPIDRL